MGEILLQNTYYKLQFQTILLSFPYSVQNMSLKDFYNPGLWKIVWKGMLQRRVEGLFLLEGRKKKKKSQDF